MVCVPQFPQCHFWRAALSNHKLLCLFYRLVIFIVLVLYCLVGWRIVQGKRALESVESDGIALDTRSTEDYFETGHEVPDRGLIGSAGSRSAARSTSPFERPNLNCKWQASRSALSLRKYILMPVMFFVVLLVVWVAPTTNRIASLVDPGFVSFPLYLAVGSTGSLRGFWNGIVFLAVGMRSRQSQKRLEEGPSRLLSNI